MLNYSNKFVLLFVLTALVSCKPKTADPEIEDNYYYRIDDSELMPNCNSEWIYEVSLLRLIASPAKYHGCMVRTIGYVIIHNNGSAMATISRENYISGDIYSAISLEFENNFEYKQYLNTSGYAIFDGVFDLPLKTISTNKNGRIMRISRFDKWEFKIDEFPPKR